jgi:cell wall-associated NlpC family hydrolase
LLRTMMPLVVALALGACAGQRAPVPVHDVSGPAPSAGHNDVAGTIGEQVALIALSMVGTPYRYGGSTPSGFDCSGLVYYAYQSVGKSVPRTSREQIRAARRIDSGLIRVGDIVYFDKLWRRGHVGIYVGDYQFVHAPSSGQHVRVDSLTHGYYSRQSARIGRLHP